MGELIPVSWQKILDCLFEAGKPMALKDLSKDETIGLTAASIHRNLADMVDAGLVERTGERKAARYTPLESVEVAWMARFGETWRRITWRAEPPFDWQYPLVSRIGDPRARETVTRFLHAVEDAGLTRPWTQAPYWMQMQDFDEHFEYSTDFGTEGGKKDLQRWLADRRNHGGVTAIVYGSCARGDPRPDSDVDILVIAPFRFPDRDFDVSLWQSKKPLINYNDRILDIAADVNLGASRPLDVTFAGKDTMGFMVPSSLRENIRKEGLTVFSTQGQEEFVEGWSGEEG